ncbi:Anthranilate phosphoribosyltransferase [bioreactor metagenome]|uniref:anthranilate phosphoribosyltransferase n=1 Tax=bioreactor metagenome TaxID=1076179 RepID=A0A644W180_9ZZZZ|nr:anthranilate phosphoribosyltransferase [Negativicutes bacterium]
MLKDYLNQVVSGEHLSRCEAKEAMNVIMSGQANDSQIGAFLTALRMKGETSAEVTGFAETMRMHAKGINCCSQRLIDTCGTGGDRKGTFNVSTTTAFVLAGAGLSVAKHGNSGVSSSCGSADVLTELGINVDLSPEIVTQAIDRFNIGFLYAPLFHTAMKHVAKPRRELGFRTVFNILGPLTNPANASCQLVGVYDGSLINKAAEALIGLGVERAMVVHSLDGMDEISTAAPTKVAEVNNGELKYYTINSADYGFAASSLDDYQGGSPAENAVILLKILTGATGAKRDIVLINAAAALVVGGLAEDMKEGILLAAKSIDSGAALAKLQALKQISSKYKEESLLL